MYQSNLLKKKRFRKSARIMSRAHEEKINSPIRDLQAMNFEAAQQREIFFIIKSSRILFIIKIVVNIRDDISWILKYKFDHARAEHESLRFQAWNLYRFEFTVLKSTVLASANLWIQYARDLFMPRYA